MRVRHVFTAAVVTIAACDEPVGEPIDADEVIIDAEEFISENPPPPDASFDAGMPDASTASAQTRPISRSLRPRRHRRGGRRSS